MIKRSRYIVTIEKCEKRLLTFRAHQRIRTSTDFVPLQRTDDTLRCRSIVANQSAIFSCRAKDGSSAIREQARTSIFWMNAETAQVIHHFAIRGDVRSRSARTFAYRRCRQNQTTVVRVCRSRLHERDRVSEWSHDFVQILNIRKERSVTDDIDYPLW